MSKVYETVTNQIIALLEQGTIPWRRPWACGSPKNLMSGKAYRGINAFVLALCSPYASPWWLTFKQAKERGGHVRQGEKGYRVLFFRFLERKRENGRIERVPLARYYTVFNVEQCEGILAPQPGRGHVLLPINACEQIVEGYPGAPTIEHGPARAFYQPSSDTIGMPAGSLFESSAEYYSTLFHEISHSTGHASRLDRSSVMDPIKFGSHTYSKEELVAVMGAAFLCAGAGIAPATIDNSAAYIKHWLSKLRDDRRMLVQAASQAQQAADWVLGRHAKQRQADEQAPVSEAA